MTTTATETADGTRAPGVPALEVVDLQSYYGRSHVVRGIHFDVQPGSGMALLGRNGAGKSTTMRSLMGLLDRSTGQVRLGGQDVHGQPPYVRARRGLALVFEDRRIIPGLSVSENLNLPSRRSAGEHLSLDEIYDMFPLLARLRSRDGGTLSGGEQQMLAIARAVRPKPSVLLLDEPSEGLAPKIVEELVVRIKDLRRLLSLAIVVAEHKQWFSREVTETMGLLASESGRMVFQGSWSDFDAHPEVADRYLSLGSSR
jgi:branched-chain amino acid transport system ATP-binding protein